MRYVYLVLEREFGSTIPLCAYLKKEDALKRCAELAKGKYDEKIGISSSLRENYEVGEYRDFGKNEGVALFSMISKKRNKPEIYFCAMQIRLE